MTDWQKDKNGRVSVNTDAVLISPNVSGVHFIKDKDGHSSFATKEDSDTYGEAVKVRNTISQFFLNNGDAFELILRINGSDFQTVASGVIETSGQGRFFVRAQLVRDALAPTKPAEPVLEEEL